MTPQSEISDDVLLGAEAEMAGTGNEIPEASIDPMQNLATDFGSVFQRLRSGTAVDVHAFADADNPRPMMLALLEWPNQNGLEGHSDGDVVAHALCDALLSAAHLGDMGSNYGVDRPEFQGASGRVFLEDTCLQLRNDGWQIINATVQIIGNRPRIAGRVTEAESAVQAIVQAPVSISATTTDHLGFLGRGEGVAAVATVLIYQTDI